MGAHNVKIINIIVYNNILYWLQFSILCLLCLCFYLYLYCTCMHSFFYNFLILPSYTPISSLNFFLPYLMVSISSFTFIFFFNKALPPETCFYILLFTIFFNYLLHLLGSFRHYY